MHDLYLVQVHVIVHTFVTVANGSHAVVVLNGVFRGLCKPATIHFGTVNVGRCLFILDLVIVMV